MRGAPVAVSAALVAASLAVSRAHAAALGHHETPPAATDSASCVEAASFARDTQHMIARVDPDTIDDWRTHRRLAGCRVTAAGVTSIGVGEEAKRFYERLRAAGWTRTPDPRDAPHEASLRFRHGATDCVFNIYGEARLGTDAEFAVNDSLATRAGAARYQLLVLCMPALPADPR